MRLPDVILLNGSTSAGKSSIARGLLEALPEPYLHVGIDTIFPWCPPAWDATPEGLMLTRAPDGSLPMRIGPGGTRLLRAWRRMVAAGVEAGMRFVVDEVFLDAAARPDWLAVLANRDVMLVGVRCDLAEMQRREIARGDRGIGQALSQHELVHSYGPYDFEVDTTRADTACCVAAILAELGRGMAARLAPPDRLHTPR